MQPNFLFQDKRRAKDAEGAEAPEFVVYHLEPGKDDNVESITDTSGTNSLITSKVENEIASCLPDFQGVVATL